MPSVSDEATDLVLAAEWSVNAMVTARHSTVRRAWARAIHDRSPRREGPFVVVCGHGLAAGNPARGAHDVADGCRRAAGGPLLIDRIGDLSAEAQDALLRRLTEPSQHRTGTTVFGVDEPVRVIAGSDRSLHSDLAVGAFCDELFYRLNVIHIDLLHQHQTGGEVMKARDIMSKPPYTCGPHTDLATVAKIMWDHDCGFVPVVDASGTVAGVVTDRDICIATSTRRLLPEHISAAQVMTTSTHACLPDDNLSDILATMKQFQIRRLPVIDAHGILQGVISLNDIVLAANDTRGPLASEIVSTMAAICAHRRVAIAVA
jgi:CBS domain-containing protein